MNLNFAPLNERVSRADIQAYERIYPHKKASWASKIVLIIVAAGLFLLLLSAILVAEYNVLIIIFIALAPAMWIYYKYIYGRKKRLALLYHFALHNQLRLIVDTPPRNYAGTIFSAGHTNLINEALILPDGVEIGSYQHTIGSGRSERVNYWGYMRVKLVRRLPNMLLDSKKNNFLWGMLSNLPATYTRDQIVKLEGNFNEFFTLYAPNGYERDAFYVFTPDVMAALIDHGSNFDIEVIDDNLVFYSAEPINLASEDELKGALSILYKISSELIDQTDYYSDERVADRVSNTIAVSGRRLKTQVSWIVIAAIVFYILALIFD